MNGPTQERLLARTSGRAVMTRDAAERKAAMRLVRRGVLARTRFGGPGIGYTTVYWVLTPALTCGVRHPRSVARP